MKNRTNEKNAVGYELSFTLVLSSSGKEGGSLSPPLPVHTVSR